MSPRPPDRVTLRWCPVCGRDDRWTDLKAGARRHFGPDGKCPGEPVDLEYRLREEAQQVPGTATLRAKLDVSVTVWPGLPHLTDGPTIIGQAHMVAGDTVEHLAGMVEAFGSLVVNQVADRIAVHPRPAPIEGWPG